MADTPKKRGRPVGSTSKKTEQVSTNESGVVYVYDSGLTKWSDPTLDIDKIKQMMRNPYLKKPVTQLMNLLFPHGDLVITVLDDEEHEDEEAAKKLRKMFRSKDCNVKKLAKRCWLSWFYWGPFCYNVVYDKALDSDGWQVIKAIRHLPSETFAGYPQHSFNGSKLVSQSELLPGISLYSDDAIRYFQIQDNGKTVPLSNVKHEAPPNDLSGDPAGMPICYVVLSLVEMLNFAWACQRQRLQRVGAPSIFLIVTDPQERTDAATGRKVNDLEYAQEVLTNWGRNNLFPLLGNMEAVPIPTNESDSAMETINSLAKLINDQWSPIGLISTEGSSKIGGGDNAGLDLLRSFRSGFLDPVSEIFVSIAEEFLEYNGYVGYYVYIKFPEFNPKNDEVDLRRAQEGRAARTISKNEHRTLLGLERATEKDLDAFAEEWFSDLEEQAAITKPEEEFPAIGGTDNKSAPAQDQQGLAVKETKIDEGKNTAAEDDS
jgi:hypothetical protein